MNSKEILGWAKHYIRHADMIFDRIAKIDQLPNGLVIEKKDGSKENVFGLDNLEELKPDKNKTTAFLPNTKHNFDVLLYRWREFAQLPNLKLIFFNPDSGTEQKWIIKPYVHNMICDEKSLKQGLKSMFDCVEVVK